MINVVCGIRSTGRICTDLATALEERGHEVKIAYGREKVPERFQKFAVKIGTELDVRFHGLLSRLFDGCGWGSKRATEKFVDWIKTYDPDIIHLHNIHGYYINLEVLFNYLKISNKRIIWTFHDCWAFTGHAAYCEAANCERWEAGCYKCPKRNDYPTSMVDRSYYNWHKKKKVIQDIPNMTIVTPSVWLAGLVRKSYFAGYPVKVINNGVDMNTFKPVNSSEMRNKLNIGDKKVILGVAAIWDDRKGLSDFFKLNEIIDTKKYKIVLVGLNKKQIEALPKNIIGINQTDSIDELVQLYSLAEVFLNPTYEDNYPTTNIEAIACGTPVITYKTGGSGESASLYGRAVDKGNVEDLYAAILNKASINNLCPDMGQKRTINEYINVYMENTKNANCFSH